MKCCSNPTYEIISLCDIKKINKEIRTQNMPWSQVSISETLNIAKDKPPIKSISKIHINVKIDSLKIIETPQTSNRNSEGINLTGKKLLVDGHVCEKIIYNSCVSNNKSLNALDFKIPFSTYIIISNETNIHRDSFNIKTCIEDVFLTPISEKTILQGASIVLFANKTSTNSIEPKPDPNIPNNIYNGIIINSIDNKEVASVMFDFDKQTISIKSTGEIPNKDLEDVDYFTLMFRNPESFIEVFSSIEANNDAKDFYDDLNNRKFDFTKTLELRYLDNTKITITNLPSKTQQFNPKATDETSGTQTFSITDKGLIIKE